VIFPIIWLVGTIFVSRRFSDQGSDPNAMYIALLPLVFALVSWRTELILEGSVLTLRTWWFKVRRLSRSDIARFTPIAGERGGRVDVHLKTGSVVRVQTASAKDATTASDILEWWRETGRTRRPRPSTEASRLRATPTHRAWPGTRDR
jgi:hypothetical protein